ncbi:MAG: KpsF/GutQ family sugar-phosphate isomerase [Alphaproteobacteria bacterium]
MAAKPTQCPDPASDNNFEVIGKKVLTAESDALRALANSLNGGFSEAVKLIAAAKGRVVVSGMGKSGHIGRKIAATLASTGTPAMFVHPGEASHGDLGMVTSDDVVVAISNSGETHELSDLIGYTRRYDLPLIGITSGAKSALAEAADVLLLLPPVAEVCPMGLAPTTSTTMTLALGDALAVAVLDHKGFTPADFRNFHPGGKLGSRLKRVADLMHAGSELPLARPDSLMSEVLMTMTERSFGCVGIVDAQGKLAGIFTDGDLRRHIGPDLLGKKAADVMTKNPLTIEAHALAAEALNILNAKRRTQLFVVDADHKPVGIIHIHDLLRAGIA